MHYHYQHLHLMSICSFILSLVPFLAMADTTHKTAATYICGQQKESGFFKYEFDFVANTYRYDDNITRQAGAAYALGEYFLYTHDAHILPCLKKAILAFDAASHQIMENKHLVSQNGTDKQSTTGATALALLAVLFYEKATGSKEFNVIREKWVRGILALHIPGKGFQSSPLTREESPYFNGEAWLALAYYEALYPGDPIVHLVLRDIDSYVMDAYTKNPTKGFYHWGMMAAAKRYETTHAPAFISFMEEQTRWIFSVDGDVQLHLNNCYLMEGFLAILPHISDQILREKVQTRIEKEMQKLQAFQIKKGQTKVPLSATHGLYFENLDSFEGGFLNGYGRPQARIDFTQHCLSAFLKGLRVACKVIL